MARGGAGCEICSETSSWEGIARRYELGASGGKSRRGRDSMCSARCGRVGGRMSEGIQRGPV